MTQRRWHTSRSRLFTSNTSYLLCGRLHVSALTGPSSGLLMNQVSKSFAFFHSSLPASKWLSNICSYFLRQLRCQNPNEDCPWQLPTLLFTSSAIPCCSLYVCLRQQLRIVCTVPVLAFWCYVPLPDLFEFWSEEPVFMSGPSDNNAICRTLLKVSRMWLNHTPSVLCNFGCSKYPVFS
jgi:hypothetical protein